jgi:hypothetical protein
MPFLQVGRHVCQCPVCGNSFICVIEQEDIDDGVEPGKLRCWQCLTKDERLGKVTQDAIREAADRLRKED